MNHLTSLTPQSSLGKRMLVGAAIGLALISFFLISAGEPNPEWGKYWRIRPLILVPFAGAMGGLCNYILIRFHQQFGVHKAIAIILSLIIFIIGLWLGTVLGLDGTYWD
jgi:ABC-type dipeptide/oligopeptide/nickel transport system permease subunit